MDLKVWFDEEELREKWDFDKGILTGVVRGSTYECKKIKNNYSMCKTKNNSKSLLKNFISLGKKQLIFLAYTSPSYKKYQRVHQRYDSNQKKAQRVKKEKKHPTQLIKNPKKKHSILKTPLHFLKS